MVGDSAKGRKPHRRALAGIGWVAQEREIFYNSCVSGAIIDAEVKKIMMPILMDQVLTEYADRAYEAARLRRNGVHTARDWVSAEMLAELEATGEAMRYLNSDGQIAWKATPSLCQHLMDLELDAKADLEDF